VLQEAIGSQVGRRLNGERRGVRNGLITHLKLYSDSNSLVRLLRREPHGREPQSRRQTHELQATRDKRIGRLHVRYG
jgi:hypothetical protein